MTNAIVQEVQVEISSISSDIGGGHTLGKVEEELIELLNVVRQKLDDEITAGSSNLHRSGR